MDGTPFCSSVNKLGSAKELGFFTATVRDQRFTTGNYSIEHGIGAISFASPILGENRKMIGVVEAKLSLPWLESYFKEQVLAEHASLTIADKYGTLLVRLPRAGKIGRMIPDMYMPFLASDRSTTTRDSSFDRVSRIVGIVPVGIPPAAEFFVSAGIAEDEALAPANLSAWVSAALVGAAMLAGVFAAQVIGRRLERSPLSSSSGREQPMRPYLALVRSNDDVQVS
jgi:hypothetical protein